MLVEVRHERRGDGDGVDRDRGLCATDHRFGVERLEMVAPSEFTMRSLWVLWSPPSKNAIRVPSDEYVDS
jgi:hypothetical protein